MNVASARILEDALQNAAQNILAKNQMGAEAQYRQAQIEQMARDTAAQLAQSNLWENRINQEEGLRGQIEQKQLAEMENQFKIKQAVQDQQEASNRVLEGLQGLSTDAKLTPGQKTAYLRSSIDSMSPQSKGAMLQNPQVKALYDGTGDWGAVSQAVQQYRGSRNSGSNAPGAQDDITVHHDAIPGTPAVPPTSENPVLHPLDWLMGNLDKPGTPGTQDQPAYDEHIRRFLPPGAGVSSQAPAAGAAAVPTQAPPIAPSMGTSAVNSNGVATGRLIKDNSGTMWNYLGNAADPRLDTNPANWKPATQ